MSTEKRINKRSKIKRSERQGGCRWADRERLFFERLCALSSVPYVVRHVASYSRHIVVLPTRVSFAMDIAFDLMFAAPIC